MTPPLRAMQDDDFANPGMFAVQDGEALWKSEGCGACHAAATMKGVAARYPAVKDGRLLNLEQRINACRKAGPWPYESKELLAMTAFIANESRGMPITVSRDAKWLEEGKKLYSRREGQINLSCAQCHDERAGQKLGGSVIPQAHPTGYPIYRLEWQGMGSLQRRLRNCMSGLRAEPYAYGSEELVALEYYLMSRASGMKLETPAVRP
ncbi:MAG: sulfur oxidation c-type cytochrome SoxA [Betaproteobacteria bacterium]|nr:sulfur oxidation c-type cytochrome SoxA [Betaproteobacteria bacterium]